MATSLDNLLKKAKKTWAETVETSKNQGGYEELPDGKYIAYFSGVEIKPSKSGDYGILSQFLILEGDHEGETKYNWINLFEPDGSLTSNAVKRLELITETSAEELDVEQLESILEDAVKDHKVYPFVLKTKANKETGKEYQNLYLNKALENYLPESDVFASKPATSAPKPSKIAKPEPEPEPEPENEDEDESVFEKGDEVTFTTGVGKARETHEGVVQSVTVNTAKVKVGTGKTAVVHTVLVSKLEAVEPEDEDEDEDEDPEIPEDEDEDEEPEDEDEDDGSGNYEEGDPVTFTLNGKEMTGEITGVDSNEQELEVKVGKKTYKVGFADVKTDEEEEEEEEEEGELAINDTVQYEDGKTGKDVRGKVVEIDAESGIITVKVGAKVVKVPADQLTILVSQ